MSNIRVLITLAVGVVAVSCAAILIKLAAAPSQVIAFYRMAFATLFLLPWALKTRPFTLTRSQIGGLCLGGIFLALHFLFWIHSFNFTSVANSVFIVTTQPIFVAVASWLILKEEVGVPLIIGILLACFGSIVIGFSDFSFGSSTTGSILALLGAIMAAGYLLVGRKLRASMPISHYVVGVYGLSSLVLLIYNLFSGAAFVGYSPQTWLSFILLALIPTVIGHTCFNWALQYVPAPIVAISTLGEPLGATILAFFILNEVPQPLTLVGGVFILIGIAVASTKRPKAAREASL